MSDGTIAWLHFSETRGASWDLPVGTAVSCDIVPCDNEAGYSFHARNVVAIDQPLPTQPQSDPKAFESTRSIEWDD